MSFIYHTRNSLRGKSLSKLTTSTSNFLTSNIYNHSISITNNNTNLNNTFSTFIHRSSIPSVSSSSSKSIRTFSTSSSAADVTDPRLGLTPEQNEYYDIALEFANNEMLPHAAKWDEEKILPVDVLRKAATLGFGAMYVNPEYGGTGLSRAEGVAVIEALAGACTSTTAYITIHNMCAWMIDSFGTVQQKNTYLPKMASMELLSSYCLTEPNAGSDAASLQTKATKDGDYYVLNGSKAFISGGGNSDLYIVMARTGTPESGAAGISTFIVPNGTPGLSFGKQEKKLGWNSQPTAAVFFENCRIPVTNRIGDEGSGFRYAMMGLDGGRLSIAACSLGAANTCFNLARDYVQVRKQFNKPLINNQTIEFKLANMATDLVLARSSVRTAATLLDNKEPLARAYCALAKKVATEKGFTICNDALQLHGGYGYLKDYPIERYVRDTRVHTILEGTNQIMDVILARSLIHSGSKK